MAMTKKERAEVDAKIRELNIRLALRWTAPVEPDIPPPKDEQTTYGWVPWSGYRIDRVEPAWSEAWRHGDGHEENAKRVASMGGIAMHSTCLRALMALRYGIEMECARRLDEVDRKIAEEAAKEAAR